VTVQAGSVWVANSGDATVTRLAVSSGRLLGEATVAAEPTAIASGEGAIWVAHDASGLVTRLDARTGEPVAAIGVGAGARALTAALGAVWVANTVDGTVSRVDPRRNAVTATIDVGGEPTAIVAHEGSIWVADARGGISGIDPSSARVRTRIEVGQSPSALVSAGGTLWVSALPSAEERGGVLRVEAFGIPSIDPAEEPQLVDGDVLRLVYDGLIAYRPAEGTAGNVLVPSLAESLPIVSNDERTYTFTLREGIVFSDGRSLTASDVERSLRRAQDHEWGQIMLGSIERVAADDGSRTVVLRLREPDPDLLYKLALPVGAVLPRSATAVPITSPVPGTGPYEIESYAPGRRIVLARNERFRSWSETARPGGLPDRIVIRFVEEADRRRDDVLAGRADIAPVGLVPESGVLATRYASQFHRWALPQTHYLFLNTRERPFDDVRVRRAVALAIDRERVTAIFGGAAATAPTCQHVPPTVPGYSPYCPFTAEPGGVSPEPDLARARALVATSGTRGMPVTVWAPADPVERAELGRYAVAVLRNLGYDARLELRPDLGSHYEAVLDPENHAQIGAYSWGNDFPTAGNSFFPMYACEQDVPHEFNPSRFCDAALSRRLEAALRGTALEPTPAATWAALDHAFLDTGAMIPLVNTTSTVVVSPRLENLVLNPQFGPLLELARVR
jgi:peptide/nickel transport system substrate-binding protein